jgi:hypothetical protein
MQAPLPGSLHLLPTARIRNCLEQQMNEAPLLIQADLGMPRRAW